ncbi:unnamed protein product [Triticum turgidum subsp. durum]|uniref:Uncharacterized protein n=2 Tax=Triticum turgidum subsp. durum TaxID=4567 RepID=A0A9R0X3H1_TRITD|nr:unnamed protein product [Triticum turgidum subsp. durum]
MGRSPCCEKAHTNKGAWTKEEDQRLIAHIKAHGEGCWRSLPKAAGLLRCGKSCRLRWINYLRPDLKRGNFTDEEDELIIKLHEFLGNKWSLIAGRLPGRTDNEIKNYWNTHVKRKLLARGVDPQTHRPLNAGTAAVQGIHTPSSPAVASGASPHQLAGGSSCSPDASGHSSDADDSVSLPPSLAGNLGVGMIDLNLSISPPCQPPLSREADGVLRTGYSEREKICLCLNRLGLHGGEGCSCVGSSSSSSLHPASSGVLRFLDASLFRDPKVQ